MQQHFNDLADYLTSQLKGSEVFTSFLTAEDSDFFALITGRFVSRSFVSQANLQVRLIDGSRQSAVTIGLVGDLEADKAQIKSQMDDLRALLPHLQDPHLLINESVQSSEVIENNKLIDTADMVDNILSESAGLDCVGIQASSNYRAFMILGGSTWFASHNFSWDWSLVHSVDKAVKSGYAGKKWDAEAFANKMSDAKAIEIVGPSVQNLEARFRQGLLITCGPLRNLRLVELGWLWFGLSQE